MSSNNKNFNINPFQGTKDILKEYKKHLNERTQHHFGYPYNLNFDHQKLGEFLKYSINNLGDPNAKSNYGVHSLDFEIQVIQYFAHLWKMPIEDCFGYITTCGTEGNLYGVLLGREAFPDGILYSSVETHYSIFKACRFYRMEYESIDTQYTGEMNYELFEKALQKHLDKPAIVNVNIGTTVKGGIDNLDKVLEILKRNGFDEDRFFIHCDGALFALILPFLEEHHDAPEVSFKKPIGSMSVSGHKFLGSPMPSGVVLTYKKYAQNIENQLKEFHSNDQTILGSRNGQAAIALWYSLREKGTETFQKDVNQCIENSYFLLDLLRKEGISAYLNKNSNTVVLERPQDDELVYKWQLACKGTICHVVVMQNVTKEKLIEFVEELKQSRIKTNTVGKVCIKEHVGDACICDQCRVVTLKSKL